MPPEKSRRDEDAIRITTAASSRQAEISARQRRYLWSMSLRSVCFVGAILVGPGILRWVLVGGALVLPYIAVVMANATGRLTDDFTLEDATPSRYELGSGTSPTSAAD